MAINKVIDILSKLNSNNEIKEIKDKIYEAIEILKHSLYEDWAINKLKIAASSEKKSEILNEINEVLNHYFY